MISFLTKSLSTTLFKFLKSAGTVFTLSTSAFKLAKFDFDANLYVSTTVTPFKSALSVYN